MTLHEEHGRVTPASLFFHLRQKTPADGRRGQAIVEFIVALVSILVLAAGLLQLTALMLAHSRTMVEARKDAGAASVQPLAPLSSPDFLKDWAPGNDAVPYTSDDRAVPSGAASQFEVLFVEHASTPAGWTQVVRSPSDRLTLLRSSMAPSSYFGLVEGSDGETVPLLPAVRSLLYNAGSVRVESKVWMTFCGGLY